MSNELRVRLIELLQEAMKLPHEVPFTGTMQAAMDELQKLIAVAGEPGPKLLLELTCSACPEQYDVWLPNREKKVGYLRLRHGYFRAEAYSGDDEEGPTVYEAQPMGDGIFEDDERDEHLKKAVAAIKLHLGLGCSGEYEMEGKPGWL